MPTTRSRSRARKELSVEDLEDLEERIEEYSKELHERLKKAFTRVEDELDEIYTLINTLGEDHNNLWGWAKRHSDLHNRVRDEWDKPPTFWEKVCLFCACWFSPETAVPAVLFGFLLGFLVDAFKS